MIFKYEIGQGKFIKMFDTIFRWFTSSIVISRNNKSMMVIRKKWIYSLIIIKNLDLSIITIVISTSNS